MKARRKRSMSCAKCDSAPSETLVTAEVSSSINVWKTLAPTAYKPSAAAPCSPTIKASMDRMVITSSTLEASTLLLKPTMSLYEPVSRVRLGFHSGRYHSHSTFNAFITSACITRLQLPIPAYAQATATAPAISAVTSIRTATFLNNSCRRYSASWNMDSAVNGSVAEATINSGDRSGTFSHPSMRSASSTTASAIRQAMASEE
jgi:hypothetical protein